MNKFTKIVYLSIRDKRIRDGQLKSHTIPEFIHIYKVDENSFPSSGNFPKILGSLTQKIPTENCIMRDECFHL